jgi:hypothetical protein
VQVALAEAQVRQLAEHTDTSRGVLVTFGADPGGRELRESDHRALGVCPHPKSHPLTLTPPRRSRH